MEIICAVQSSALALIPPEGDLKTMNFGSGGNTKAKAWKDIWGSGQGIGAVTAVDSVADRVDRLEAEFNAAKAELAAKLR